MMPRHRASVNVVESLRIFFSFSLEKFVLVSWNLVLLRRFSAIKKQQIGVSYRTNNIQDFFKSLVKYGFVVQWQNANVHEQRGQYSRSSGSSTDMSAILLDIKNDNKIYC